MNKACYSVKELTNQVVLGDAYSELVKFPDACVDAVVTSPPYYSQRDYENGAQIGTEGSIEKYLERLFCVFSECRRILKPSGCLWLNIGDKYLNGNLASLPWRLAIQLQDKGKFILRSDIIWYKPNAMPSSVKNRPTTDHEYIFSS